jgi:hypothetical protein
MLDNTGIKMKSTLMTMILALLTTVAFSQDTEHVSTTEKYQAKILDVILINSDGFEYTGYQIEYNGTKTVVSPVIAFKKFKVGEEVTIMVMKFTNHNPLDKKDIKSISLTLIASPNSSETPDK